MSEPTKPDDKKKPDPRRLSGLGDVMRTSGGMPAPQIEDTSALQSETLMGLEQLAKEGAADPPLQPGLGQVLAVASGMLPPSPAAGGPGAEAPVVPPPPDLALRLRKPRTLFSAVMSVLAGMMAVMAMVPLVSVLGMLLWRG